MRLEDYSKGRATIEEQAARIAVLEAHINPDGNDGMRMALAGEEHDSPVTVNDLPPRDEHGHVRCEMHKCSNTARPGQRFCCPAHRDEQEKRAERGWRRAREDSAAADPHGTFTAAAVEARVAATSEPAVTARATECHSVPWYCRTAPCATRLLPGHT